MITFATAAACAWAALATAGEKAISGQDEIGPGEPITYVAPEELRTLPSRVRSELKQMNCRVPKKGWWGHRNVIRGSFARKGQRDWAVVCSIEGKFHIHLFWGGNASCSSEIPLRGWNPLEPVGERYVAQMYMNFGGRKPPPITHDGLDAIYPGKAVSVIFYCHEGTWLKLTGSD